MFGARLRRRDRSLSGTGRGVVPGDLGLFGHDRPRRNTLENATSGQMPAVRRMNAIGRWVAEIIIWEANTSPKSVRLVVRKRHHPTEHADNDYRGSVSTGTPRVILSFDETQPKRGKKHCKIILNSF
jgi:hypothetical protein